MNRWPAPQRVPIASPRGASEIELSVHRAGRGPAVVLCHGFPELAFSWRHQLPALADAGFEAIAPDQRGYGASTVPRDVEAYDLACLTGDLVGMLDALEIERAVFVGHDWGGFVAWAMPLLHPERCAGVAGVCTPYAEGRSLDDIRALVDGEDERFYILWFQQPGVAEKVMDPQVRLIFDRLMRKPLPPDRAAARMLVDGQFDMNPFRRMHTLEPETEPIVSAEELDTYVEAFERTGFGGGICWYRNIERNRSYVPDMGVRKLDLPCLMITAEWDVALRPEMAAGMPEVCSDLEIHRVERAGHWVQQESPEKTNAILVDWLVRRFR